MRVSDLMDPEPPTATVPGSRAELLTIFKATTLPGVPVLKAGTRKLAGLVMRTDLVREPRESQIALLMNPNPITMYTQASAREAASFIAKNRCPVLPVVTASNDLVGLLTTQELLEALFDNKGRAQTYLHGRVVPVHRSTPARVAAKILQLTGASALPVLDDEGRLVGIATDGDLLGASREELVTEKSQHGMAPDEDAWNREGLGDARSREHSRTRLHVPTKPIENFMVRNVRSLAPLAYVGEAARIMFTNDWSQLPIVDEEGHLLDILTDVDLMSAFV